MPTQLTAFLGHTRVAAGPAADVAIALKALAGDEPQSAALVFDDATGRQIDLDLSGTVDAVRNRYAPEPGSVPVEAPADDGGTVGPAGRGRPKLGVIAREVTLLPRHWDWLAAQPGGASVALRKLVEDARRKSAWDDTVRAIREATGRFLTAIAGDLPGYEEATRALYAGDASRFAEMTAAWPRDIGEHARRLAEGALV